MGKILILLLVSCFGLVGLNAQEVALTFDDGPKLVETPLLSPAERNQAILDTLAKHHLKAALFVTAANGAIKPEGLALARAWGAAGHLVGNHTMTHPDLNSSKETLAAYEQEILDCDALIRNLPGYGKYFRFTFLREGNTPEKRDGIRAFLKERGYRNAYVTLDTSDWRLDQKLVEVLTKNPEADLEPIRAVYLEHLLQRAGAYRDLSRKLLGRDIPQVMLLHHNLLEALFLDSAIARMQQDGWHFVDPRKAYEDPVYQLQPDRPVPGQSLLLSLARSRGMDLKPYARLMDDGDFEIGELEKKGY